MKQTENKKLRYFFFISLFIAVPFIFLYAGHFLFLSIDESNAGQGEFAPSQSIPKTDMESSDVDKSQMMNPVRYMHSSEIVNGLKQEINILEIDPGAEGVRIQPILSHDLIYGFEMLKDMAERKKAYAAVNGGFFYEYGQPSGMVVINGELISASTGRYPVLVVENGKAVLKEIGSELTVEYSGNVYESNSNSSESNSNSFFKVDGLNSPVNGKRTVVYTPMYGLYNRAGEKNITATIEKGVVTKVAFCEGETEIPQDGMLISFFDTQRYKEIEMPLSVGDEVRLLHKPNVGKNANAYECGSWLVKDGKSVVQSKDAWVGVMTNRDPRTAVGIKENGNVILLTVDGRQPDYSAGFTGEELARYLISCGAMEAAMLDGGASTEMLVEGELVNTPSFKGKERPLAGGILILQDE